MSLVIDAKFSSLKKSEEELSGEVVEILNDSLGTTVIFAAATGAGVKANMLATMTLKMIISLLAHGEGIEEAVKAGYAGFAIIRVQKNGAASLVEMDMPEAILLQRGKPIVMKRQEKLIGIKLLKESTFTLKAGAMLTVCGHGVFNAGKVGSLKSSWGRDMVIAYLQAAYKPQLSAAKVTELLLKASSSLDDDYLPNDLTVIAIQASKSGV